jgi:bifunctional oligoribonuclease and PAP phosphatase NrnA
MRSLEHVFDRVRDAIKTHHKFVVTTHVNADGDGIGSELGLSRFLVDLGKSVKVLNSTPTPRNYQFLAPNGEIRLFDSQNPMEHLSDAEVIFIVDISKWERLGPMTAVIKNHPAIKICIDHHPLNGNFADVDLVCEDACASGELVLSVIDCMNGNLTQAIAEPLYASILTDTGTFRFPNTNSKTHAAASRLLATNIRSSEIYEQIYERCSPARVKLLGLCLTDLQYLHQGRLAWMMITQAMMRQTGVEPEEVEGFVDIARGIRNVEASLLFLELPDGRVKVSLRSKGEIDVNRYAGRFGGGGHRHASGILMNGPIASAANEVLQHTSELFIVPQKLVS